MHHATFIGADMDKGLPFLKSQIDNAVMQHSMLLRSLQDNEAQAQDERYRDLCARHLPNMREHQRMLEEFQAKLGGVSSSTSGIAATVKDLAGRAAGIARELADAPRQSDFLRLVGDHVLARQSEDTFKTFREAGRALGITELAHIGETGERQHDDYAQDANRLVQQMFIERARGAEQIVRSVADRPTAY
jgi:hypothetical protein